MTRKRKTFGDIQHSTYKVNRASWLMPKAKKMRVIVTLSRSPTGAFHAHACAYSYGKSVKARHCSRLTGAFSPTKAAGLALEHLGTQLQKRG